MADDYDSDNIPVRERGPGNHRPTSPYHQKCIDYNTNAHLLGLNDLLDVTPIKLESRSSFVCGEGTKVFKSARSCSIKTKIKPNKYFPYRTKDFFELPCNVDDADRQAVIRFSRDELENRYLKITEENLLLKKSLNEQAKTLKRLQVQVQRLESGGKKRTCSPASQLNEERIRKLEEVKRLLEGKVIVLKQQLQAHSKLHAQVHRNFPNSPGPRRMCRSSTPGGTYSGYTNDYNSRICDSPNPASEYSRRPLTSYGETRDNLRNPRDLSVECGGQFMGLDLEDEIMSQHFDDCDPLEDCPEQDDCQGNMSKVAENIELIRLKRLLKRQAAQLAAMTAHSELSEKEIGALKSDCRGIAHDNEHMKKMLNCERQKVQSMLREVTHVSAFKQDIRMLEEQVRDLKQEKLQLKDHNEKLLKLAANKCDGGEGDVQIELCESHLHDLNSTFFDVGDLEKQMMLGLNVASNEISVHGSADDSRITTNNTQPGGEQNLYVSKCCNESIEMIHSKNDREESESYEEIIHKINVNKQPAKKPRTCVCSNSNGNSFTSANTIEEAILRDLLPEYDIEHVIVVTEYVNSAPCSTCVPCGHSQNVYLSPKYGSHAINGGNIQNSGARSSRLSEQQRRTSKSCGTSTGRHHAVNRFPVGTPDNGGTRSCCRNCSRHMSRPGPPCACSALTSSCSRSEEPGTENNGMHVANIHENAAQTSGESFKVIKFHPRGSVMLEDNGVQTSAENFMICASHAGPVLNQFLSVKGAMCLCESREGKGDVEIPDDAAILVVEDLPADSAIVIEEIYPPDPQFNADVLSQTHSSSAGSEVVAIDTDTPVILVYDPNIQDVLPNLDLTSLRLSLENQPITTPEVDTKEKIAVQDRNSTAESYVSNVTHDPSIQSDQMASAAALMHRPSVKTPPHSPSIQRASSIKPQIAQLIQSENIITDELSIHNHLIKSPTHSLSLQSEHMTVNMAQTHIPSIIIPPNSHLVQSERMTADEASIHTPSIKTPPHSLSIQSEIRTAEEAQAHILSIKTPPDSHLIQSEHMTSDEASIHNPSLKGPPHSSSLQSEHLTAVDEQMNSPSIKTPPHSPSIQSEIRTADEAQTRAPSIKTPPHSPSIQSEIRTADEAQTRAPSIKTPPHSLSIQSEMRTAEEAQAHILSIKTPPDSHLILSEMRTADEASIHTPSIKTPHSPSVLSEIRTAEEAQAHILSIKTPPDSHLIQSEHMTSDEASIHNPSLKGPPHSSSLQSEHLTVVDEQMNSPSIKTPPHSPSIQSEIRTADEAQTRAPSIKTPPHSPSIQSEIRTADEAQMRAPSIKTPPHSPSIQSEIRTADEAQTRAPSIKTPPHSPSIQSEIRTADEAQTRAPSIKTPPHSSSLQSEQVTEAGALTHVPSIVSKQMTIEELSIHDPSIKSEQMSRGETPTVAEPASENGENIIVPTPSPRKLSVNGENYAVSTKSSSGSYVVQSSIQSVLAERNLVENVGEPEAVTEQIQETERQSIAPTPSPRKLSQKKTLNGSEIAEQIKKDSYDESLGKTSVKLNDPSLRKSGEKSEQISIGGMKKESESTSIKSGKSDIKSLSGQIVNPETESLTSKSAEENVDKTSGRSIRHETESLLRKKMKQDVDQLSGKSVILETESNLGKVLAEVDEHTSGKGVSKETESSSGKILEQYVEQISDSKVKKQSVSNKDEDLNQNLEKIDGRSLSSSVKSMKLNGEASSVKSKKHSGGSSSVKSTKVPGESSTVKSTKLTGDSSVKDIKLTGESTATIIDKATSVSNQALGMSTVDTATNTIAQNIEQMTSMAGLGSKIDTSTSISETDQVGLGISLPEEHSIIVNGDNVKPNKKCFCVNTRSDLEMSDDSLTSSSPTPSNSDSVKPIKKCLCVKAGSDFETSDDLLTCCSPSSLLSSSSSSTSSSSASSSSSSQSLSAEDYSSNVNQKEEISRSNANSGCSFVLTIKDCCNKNVKTKCIVGEFSVLKNLLSSLINQKKRIEFKIQASHSSTNKKMSHIKNPQKKNDAVQLSELSDQNTNVNSRASLENDQTSGASKSFNNVTLESYNETLLKKSESLPKDSVENKDVSAKVYSPRNEYMSSLEKSNLLISPYNHVSTQTKSVSLGDLKDDSLASLSLPDVNKSLHQVSEVEPPKFEAFSPTDLCHIDFSFTDAEKEITQEYKKENIPITEYSTGPNVLPKQLVPTFSTVHDVDNRFLDDMTNGNEKHEKLKDETSKYQVHSPTAYYEAGFLPLFEEKGQSQDNVMVSIGKFEDVESPKFEAVSPTDHLPEVFSFAAAGDEMTPEEEIENVTPLTIYSTEPAYSSKQHVPTIRQVEKLPLDDMKISNEKDERLGEEPSVYQILSPVTHYQAGEFLSFEEKERPLRDVTFSTEKFEDLEIEIPMIEGSFTIDHNDMRIFSSSEEKNRSLDKNTDNSEKCDRLEIEPPKFQDLSPVDHYKAGFFSFSEEKEKSLDYSNTNNSQNFGSLKLESPKPVDLSPIDHYNAGSFSSGYVLKEMLEEEEKKDVTDIKNMSYGPSSSLKNLLSQNQLLDGLPASRSSLAKSKYIAINNIDDNSKKEAFSSPVSDMEDPEMATDEVSNFSFLKVENDRQEGSLPMQYSVDIKPYSAHLLLPDEYSRMIFNKEEFGNNGAKHTMLPERVNEDLVTKEKTTDILPQISFSKDLNLVKSSEFQMSSSIGCAIENKPCSLESLMPIKFVPSELTLEQGDVFTIEKPKSVSIVSDKDISGYPLITSQKEILDRYSAKPFSNQQGLEISPVALKSSSEFSVAGNPQFGHLLSEKFSQTRPTGEQSDDIAKKKSESAINISNGDKSYVPYSRRLSSEQKTFEKISMQLKSSLELPVIVKQHSAHLLLPKEILPRQSSEVQGSNVSEEKHEPVYATPKDEHLSSYSKEPLLDPLSQLSSSQQFRLQVVPLELKTSVTEQPVDIKKYSTHLLLPEKNSLSRTLETTGFQTCEKLPNEKPDSVSSGSLLRPANVSDASSSRMPLKHERLKVVPLELNVSAITQYPVEDKHFAAELILVDEYLNNRDSRIENKNIKVLKKSLSSNEVYDPDSTSCDLSDSLSSEFSVVNHEERLITGNDNLHENVPAILDLYTDDCLLKLYPQSDVSKSFKVAHEQKSNEIIENYHSKGDEDELDSCPQICSLENNGSVLLSTFLDKIFLNQYVNDLTAYNREINNLKSEQKRLKELSCDSSELDSSVTDSSLFDTATSATLSSTSMSSDTCVDYFSYTEALNNSVSQALSSLSSKLIPLNQKLKGDNQSPFEKCNPLSSFYRTDTHDECPSRIKDCLKMYSSRAPVSDFFDVSSTCCPCKMVYNVGGRPIIITPIQDRDYNNHCLSLARYGSDSPCPQKSPKLVKLRPPPEVCKKPMLQQQNRAYGALASAKQNQNSFLPRLKKQCQITNSAKNNCPSFKNDSGNAIPPSCLIIPQSYCVDGPPSCLNACPKTPRGVLKSSFMKTNKESVPPISQNSGVGLKSEKPHQIKTSGNEMKCCDSKMPNLLDSASCDQSQHVCQAKGDPNAISLSVSNPQVMPTADSKQCRLHPKQDGGSLLNPCFSFEISQNGSVSEIVRNNNLKNKQNQNHNKLGSPQGLNVNKMYNNQSNTSDSHRVDCNCSVHNNNYFPPTKPQQTVHDIHVCSNGEVKNVYFSVQGHMQLPASSNVTEQSIRDDLSKIYSYFHEPNSDCSPVVSDNVPANHSNIKGRENNTSNICRRCNKKISRKLAENRISKLLPNQTFLQYFLTTHMSPITLINTKNVLLVGEKFNNKLPTEYFDYSASGEKYLNTLTRQIKSTYTGIKPSKKFNSEINKMCSTLSEIVSKTFKSIKNNDGNLFFGDKKKQNNIINYSLKKKNNDQKKNVVSLKSMALKALCQSKEVLSSEQFADTGSPKNKLFNIRKCHVNYFCPRNESIQDEFEKEVEALKTGLTQTTEELERVRELLEIQFKVNCCYREEVDNLSLRLKEKCKHLAKSLPTSSTQSQQKLNESEKIKRDVQGPASAVKENELPTPLPRASLLSKASADTNGDNASETSSRKATRRRVNIIDDIKPADLSKIRSSSTLQSVLSSVELSTGIGDGLKSKSYIISSGNDAGFKELRSLLQKLESDKIGSSIGCKDKYNYVPTFNVMNINDDYCEFGKMYGKLYDALDVFHCRSYDSMFTKDKHFCEDNRKTKSESKIEISLPFDNYFKDYRPLNIKSGNKSLSANINERNEPHENVLIQRLSDKGDFGHRKPSVKHHSAKNKMVEKDKHDVSTKNKKLSWSPCCPIRKITKSKKSTQKLVDTKQNTRLKTDKKQMTEKCNVNPGDNLEKQTVKNKRISFQPSLKIKKKISSSSNFLVKKNCKKITSKLPFGKKLKGNERELQNQKKVSIPHSLAEKQKRENGKVVFNTNTDANHNKCNENEQIQNNRSSCEWEPNNIKRTQVSVAGTKFEEVAEIQLSEMQKNKSSFCDWKLLKDEDGIAKSILLPENCNRELTLIIENQPSECGHFSDKQEKHFQFDKYLGEKQKSLFTNHVSNWSTNELVDNNSESENFRLIQGEGIISSTCYERINSGIGCVVQVIDNYNNNEEKNNIIHDKENKTKDVLQDSQYFLEKNEIGFQKNNVISSDSYKNITSLDEIEELKKSGIIFSEQSELKMTQRYCHNAEENKNKSLKNINKKLSSCIKNPENLGGKVKTKSNESIKLNETQSKINVINFNETEKESEVKSGKKKKGFVYRSYLNKNCKMWSSPFSSTNGKDLRESLAGIGVGEKLETGRGVNKKFTVFNTEKDKKKSKTDSLNEKRMPRNSFKSINCDKVVMTTQGIYNEGKQLDKIVNKKNKRFEKSVQFSENGKQKNECLHEDESFGENLFSDKKQEIDSFKNPSLLENKVLSIPESESMISDVNTESNNNDGKSSVCVRPIKKHVVIEDQKLKERIINVTMPRDLEEIELILGNISVVKSMKTSCPKEERTENVKKIKYLLKSGLIVEHHENSGNVEKTVEQTFDGKPQEVFAQPNKNKKITEQFLDVNQPKFTCTHVDIFTFDNVSHASDCGPECSIANNNLKKVDPKKDCAVFQIFIVDLLLNKESLEYLRSVEPCPRVFLTWRFLDFHETAYSTLQPADEAIFNCSSEYHGPISKGILQFMEMCNVFVECHLQMKETSKIVAVGEFTVSSVLNKPNQKHMLSISLRGESVSGNLNCWCQLNSELLAKEVQEEETEI